MRVNTSASEQALAVAHKRRQRAASESREHGATTVLDDRQEGQPREFDSQEEGGGVLTSHPGTICKPCTD